MDLYKKPGNLFVAQFIGSPAMNVLPATIERPGSPTAVRLAAETVAHVPIATPASAKGETVSFGVRPEDLFVTEDPDDTLFSGQVDYIEQLGEVQLVYIDIGRGDQPLTAKLSGSAEVKRGQTIRLAANPADLHIFDKDGRSFLHKEPAAEAA
jgi:multiple sugar transport system ATP-binding protein/alpha-glucoside transport system ATP-binding protein